MKKLSLIVAGLGLIAGITVQAADTNVTSVNIVGYNTVTMPSNQYTMVGVCFDKVGGDSMTLAEMFGTNQLKMSVLPGQADKVILWNVVSQQYTQYAQRPDGTFRDINNYTGPAFTSKVSVSRGFWLKSVVSSNRNICLLGEVPSDGAITNQLTGSAVFPYQMIANPYPVAVQLSSIINTNNGAKAAALPGQADRIILWNSQTQQYFTLGLKLADNNWHDVNAWTGSAYTNEVGVGVGFWFRAKTNFTWIVQKTF